MHTRFTFKHLEPLQSITDYAQMRIGKIEKYALHKEPKIHFIFGVQKNDQVAECLVDVGQFHFAAVAKDESLYTAIDRVVEKLERQLTKHKEKVQKHKRFEQSNEGILARQMAEETLTLREKFVAERATRSTKRNAS